MLEPEKICANTSKAYYWLCKEKHSWKAALPDRIQGSGCPYCVGKRICLETSVYKKCPSVMKEWDYEKNTVVPKTIGINSNLKVYWKCKNNHSWLTSPGNRIKGRNCAYCQKEKIAQNKLNSV